MPRRIARRRTICAAALAALATSAAVGHAELPDEPAELRSVMLDRRGGQVLVVYGGSGGDALRRVELGRHGAALSVDIVLAQGGDDDLTYRCIAVPADLGGVRRVVTGEPPRRVRLVRRRKSREGRVVSRLCRYAPRIAPEPAAPRAVR